MTTSIRSEATRSIVAVNGVDKLAINEDGSMELLTPAANPTGNDVPTAGQLGFGKMYESPEQTITANSTITFAHGLAGSPSLAQAFVICKVAELGYSVGDVLKIDLAVGSGSSTTIYNYQLSFDDTNIHATCAMNGLVALNKSTAAYSPVTTANWRLIVRAWA